MTVLTFTQSIIGLFVLILGVIAIRLTLNFDINEYQKVKQDKYRTKCQNACLHFEFVPQADKTIEAHSFFVSPSGTLSYICQRCGVVLLHLDREATERTYDYYYKNIEEYTKQNKKFHKLLKKAGMVA